VNYNLNISKIGNYEFGKMDVGEMEGACAGEREGACFESDELHGK